MLLPTQLGKHFWPDYAYVLGLRIDYLSPTLYLSDIFICITIFLFALEYLPKIHFPKTPKALRLSLILLCLVFVSVAYFLVHAEDAHPVIYWVFKLLETVGFGIMTAVLLQKRPVKQSVFWVISCVLVFLSFLAFWQFVQQETVGGVFYWLGERTFSVNTPGIAAGNIDGRLVLRPYAIFPHPNVFAGYIIFALSLSYFFAKDIYGRIPKLVFPIWLLSSLTVILTMSSAAIFLLVVFWAVYFLTESRRRKKTVATVGITLTFLILFMQMHNGRVVDLSLSSESIHLRRELGFISGQMILSAPIFGLGPNQFLSSLPKFSMINLDARLLQPVHNIFLLTFAELGFLGLSALIIFLSFFAARIVRAKTSKAMLWFVFFSFCFIGVLEHYFLTLQQGQLLFAFIFGALYAETNKYFGLQNLEKFPNSKTNKRSKLRLNEKYSIGRKKSL